MTAGTSLLGYPVQIGTATYGAADDPVDTAIMRAGVGNGLLHYADGAGQMRISACYQSGLLTGGGGSSGTVESTPNANQWYLLEGGILGPWPLTCYGDATGPSDFKGYPYRCRVYLRGKTTNASGSCVFALVLCPLGRSLEYLPAPSGAPSPPINFRDHVWISSAVTSTSFAWLTGASRGPLDFANAIQVRPELAQDWTTTENANETSSTLRTVDQVLVALHVYARTSNNAGVPTVSAVSLEEFGGR